MGLSYVEWPGICTISHTSVSSELATVGGDGDAGERSRVDSAVEEGIASDGIFTCSAQQVCDFMEDDS